MADPPSSSSPEDNGQLIYQAVMYNNYELLSELLIAARDEKDKNEQHANEKQMNEQCNLEFRDAHGYTPLHVAAANGYMACLELLLAAGADVNATCDRDRLLRTPLHVAASQGNHEVVRRLIASRGVDLMHVDMEEHCALELAQMGSHIETACLLIDALEAERDLATRLHERMIVACTEGDTREVERILNEEMYAAIADVVFNGTNRDEQHALYIACQHGYGEIVSVLLRYSGHLLLQKTTNDTVLHAAIASQNLVIVLLILKSFSHLVRVANADGSLPLHWACQCGSLEIVRALLDRRYAESALIEVHDPTGAMQYRFPFDVNAVDKECRTALYLAVANGHLEIVRYLLQFEIETRPGSGKRMRPFAVDVYCTGGRTPLMIAAANGSVALVQLLIDYGANVNLPIALTDAEIESMETDEARCVGSGALNEACRTGHAPLAAMLLRHNAVDHDNRALAMAVQNGHEPIVRLLLSRLVFADPEFRINKKSMEFLGGQMSMNRNLLPCTVYPTTSCMLNWHGAGLVEIAPEWLLGACVQLNAKLKTSRMALAALTRIDVSGNRLECLSSHFLQLPSLRTLNAGHNRICRLETSVEGWNAPMLETINLEHNLIDRLPDMMFCSLLGNLQTLDVSHNKLTTLPDSIWAAPKLREFNASYNALTVLPAMHNTASGGGDAGSSSAQQLKLEAMQTRASNDSLNSTAATRGASAGSNALDDHVQVLELCRHNLWQRSIQLAKVDDDEIDQVGAIAGAVACSPLVQLNLAGNQLAFVPSCLACVVPRLLRLNLAENHLSSLGPISSYPARLRHLDLSKNRLAGTFATPTPIELVCHSTTGGATRPGGEMRSTSPTRQSRSRSKSAVRSRRSLSVTASTGINDSKQIVQFEACAHKRHNRLEWLKTLLLNGNRITDVAITVASCEITSANTATNDARARLLFPNLTVLDVSDNRVRALPRALSEMTSLSVLNASNNSAITELPAELALLTRLWNLNLKGCRLREPMRTMIAENYKTTDLIAYLKSILEE